MTITGSVWQKITLGTLIPALDPDDENSAANRIVREVNRIEDQISSSMVTMENTIGQVSTTLNRAKELADEIAILQNEIDDLVGNAVNTGVYAHTLGLNPIFSATQPLQLVTEIRRTLNDTSDPNRPQFRGDTALVGGMLLLISAPNAQEMVAAIQRLSVIFPIFNGVVEALAIEGEVIADVFAEDFLNPVTNELSQLGTDFANLKAKDLGSVEPFVDLFDQAVNDVPEFEGFDTTAYKKWFALRISDLIPALNPAQEGSPAKALVDTERAVVNGGISLLQQAGGLAGAANLLARGINDLNETMQRLATDVTDLVTALGNTGIFVHLIGLDGSVSNTDEFADAAGRSLLDLTDPNRPRASGELLAFAGLELVWGAANPVGLKEKFDSVSSVFEGLIGDAEKVREVAGF